MCQCGGACCGNSLVPSSNEMVFTLPAELLKGLTYGMLNANNANVNGNEETCFCENCSGGVSINGGGGGICGSSSDGGVGVNYINGPNSASLGHILASIGFNNVNAANFQQQAQNIQQQQQQQHQQQQQQIIPYDFAAPNVLNTAYDNEDDGPCKFCCVNNGYEYIIC
jgi:hypothetical protein